MAVVRRKRKSGVTYYVTTIWRGTKYWENAGHDVREARRTARRRRQEVKDGTYVPRQVSAQTTVAAFGEAWLARRTARWKDGHNYLRREVLGSPWLGPMALEDVRKRHALDMLEEMRRRVNEKTGKPRWGEKTIANILGLARTMFQDAVDREMIAANPFVLPRGRIDRSRSRPRKAYSLETAQRILTCPEVHPSMRVFAALALLTGGREGELCGFRVGDLDRSTSPLWCLSLERQYAGGLLKTERRAGTHSRLVPVHPALRAVLDWWLASGFELVHLRAPVATDPLVPRKGLKPHTRSSAYKAWRRVCKLAAVENLSLHSTRHTFISLARGGGGREDVVERITHNASGSVVDRYTHWTWGPLCEAVLCIRLGDREVHDPGPLVVTGGLTHQSSTAALPVKSVVEAQGIETGGLVGNIGNSADGQGNDSAGDPPSFSRNTQVAHVAGAARQPHRFPLAEATLNLALLLAGVT